MTNCYRCNNPVDAEGECRQAGCSAAWEAVHRERDEARADAEHWRREAELRQALLENERQLCATHEAKRDEARAEVDELTKLVRWYHAGCPSHGYPVADRT